MTEAEYLRKYYPGQAEKIVSYADMFLRHEFLFNTENDLDNLGEPVKYGQKIDWAYNPGKDREYVWQFNRQRYFVTLGLAYKLTGDEKYAKLYVEDLEDWIDSNPYTEEAEATTWRILEAGFRGEYWTRAWNLFAGSPFITAELTQKYYDCVCVHCDYILSRYNTYSLLSNWGLIENHGLFMMALSLPKSEKSQMYIEKAIDHVSKQCRIAIAPDGVEWEQSPNYHHEVMNGLLDVIMYGNWNQIELPAIIRDTVYKMSMASLTWQKPNLRGFAMGDSDDVDISKFLCKAAYIFQDPVLKWGARDIPDMETIFDIGVEACESFEKLERKAPDYLSAQLADTGNTYLRSDWSEDANLFHLHCGTLGAGHGHSDQLHIDLVARGEDVLVDGGRYTYMDCPKRKEFKDPSMHNTIRVDGQDFTIYKDNWESSKLSQPVRQPAKLGGDYEFVQAGQLGYMDLGVYVNRKVIYIRPDVYIISDACYADREHEYEAYFHFDSKGHIDLVDNVAIFHGAKGDTRVEFLGDVDSKHIRTHQSRGYNHEEDNDCVLLTKHGNGTTTFMTVIYAGDGKFSCEKIPALSALKRIEYPDHMAEAVKITVDNKEYVVTICHQEVNSPTDLIEADGCCGFGNVIVFDKSVETEIGNVLYW